MDSKGRIVIAGGSGLIGAKLSAKLKTLGYEVVLLSRSGGSGPGGPGPGGLGRVRWDAETVGPWKSVLESAAGVINLAGRSVNCKWTEANKREIIESRLKSSKAIGDAVAQCEVKPKVWINASAIGIYGSRDDDARQTESSPIGTGYLAETTHQWESAIFDHPAEIRKVAIRIGIVLSRQGGALVPLETLTKLFLGGTVGNGRQGMSWIHIDDLVDMFVFALENPVEGRLNGTAPNPVSNAEFMAELRRTMKKPWAPPAPAFGVRLVTGIMGPDPSLVLDGVFVDPKRPKELGFAFQYPQLDRALRQLFS